jgi:hypothetical protein
MKHMDDHAIVDIQKVVVAYDCKLIFHDKIFNTFIFDAKSVEGFTNKLIENIYLTILTFLCLIR